MRIKRSLVKKVSNNTEPNEKADLIEEIKSLNSIINVQTDQNTREEWIKACDKLNAISDSKKYWQHFSKLVEKFKNKVYADLKRNGETATNDKDRASFFAEHMADV